MGDQVSFRAEREDIMPRAREHVERKVEKSIREGSRGDSDRVNNQGEGGGESVIER